MEHEHLPRTAATEVAERVLGAAAEHWQDRSAARRQLAREPGATCAECLARVIGAMGPVTTSASQRAGVGVAAWARYVKRTYT